MTPHGRLHRRKTKASQTRRCFVDPNLGIEDYIRLPSLDALHPCLRRSLALLKMRGVKFGKSRRRVVFCADVKNGKLKFFYIQMLYESSQQSEPHRMRPHIRANYG